MTDGQKHIVVCDDEPDIREMLQEYLIRKGYEVSCAEDGRALRALADERQIDAIILDLNMPGEDGLSLARHFSDRGNTAIIMLTAAGDVVDRVVGLEMGADDYLTKPVDLRELHARIRAVLRRGNRGADLSAPSASSSGRQVVAFGRCVLDLTTHQLRDEAGGEIPITAMEFALLKVFAENAGRVLNRDQLLELAHGRGWDPFDRSIDIRISRLRKKIEADPSKPDVIKTIRGIGYVFNTGAS